ncbi:MAG: hypothetical protein ACRCX2_29140 [Paraclostridium sp.]
MSIMTSVRDCKCHECGRTLEKDIHGRVAIIAKSKDITLCKCCFADLKKEISQM